MKSIHTITSGIAVAAVLFSINLTAQQLPQFSQYMHNMYLLNPAAACTDSDAEANLGYRQQWSGFDGAPFTYYLNGAVNLGKKPLAASPLLAIPISTPSIVHPNTGQRYPKHVVSAMAAVDEYGLFKRTSVMAGYAYHHPVGDKSYLAVGTSMGWYGLTFGASQVRLENPLDLIYNDFVSMGTQSNLFDINAGVYFYNDRFFAGYSVYQLGQNEINLGNETTPANLSDAQLQMHHYATVGYTFALGENFTLTPSTMVKVRPPAPVSADVNVKVEWQERFWMGLSYRNEDAVAIMAGLSISDWLRIGYSYDYVVSQINNLSSGSHEIMLGLKLNRKTIPNAN